MEGLKRLSLLLLLSIVLGLQGNVVAMSKGDGGRGFQGCIDWVKVGNAVLHRAFPAIASEAASSRLADIGSNQIKALNTVAQLLSNATKKVAKAREGGADGAIDCVGIDKLADDMVAAMQLVVLPGDKAQVNAWAQGIDAYNDARGRSDKPRMVSAVVVDEEGRLPYSAEEVAAFDQYIPAAGPSESKRTRTNLVCAVEACKKKYKTAQELKRHMASVHQPLVDSDDVSDDSESPIAVAAGGDRESRIDKMRKMHPSTLPISSGLLGVCAAFLDSIGVCAAFLDSNSRQALGASSLTINQLVKPAVEVTFKVNTPREVILSKLRRCPWLKKLNLNFCLGSAGFIEGLAAGAGEQLEELNLDCTGATADQVRAIVQRCPLLKKLILSGCRGSAGVIAGLPAGAGEQLEELNLDCTGATADQVRAIVEKCLQLKKLDLQFCPGAAGFIEGLEAGAGRQLEELDLGATGATAEQVSTILQRCPQLKMLKLLGCQGASGFIVGLDAGAGEQLEKLELWWTGATADQLRVIVQRCPKLKKLNLLGCQGVAGFIAGLEAGAGEQLDELDLSFTDATVDQIAAIQARFPRCRCVVKG